MKAQVLGLSASRGESVNSLEVASAPLGQMASGHSVGSPPPAPGC